MKLPKIAIFIVFFVLLIVGGFGVFTMHNTFVVENTSAALDNQVVYLTADDISKNPQALVEPKPETSVVEVLPNEIGYLNVRSGAGASNAKIGQVKPGDELKYTEVKSNWYHIVLADGKTGWVSGDYVKKLEG